MKKEKEPTNEEKTVEVAEAPEQKAESTADDFFSAGQADEEMKDFIDQMKRPREKVEMPPVMMEDELEEEKIQGGAPDPDGGESDQEMLSHFDYNEEHRLTAEFMLVQLDKLIAFSCSVVSGMESDRYRRRKGKMEGEDYEAEILAALVKKYQMRLSLEWMFASAIVMGYAPIAQKAMNDRKVSATKKTKTDGA